MKSESPLRGGSVGDHSIMQAKEELLDNSVFDGGGGGNNNNNNHSSEAGTSSAQPSPSSQYGSPNRAAQLSPSVSVSASSSHSTLSYPRSSPTPPRSRAPSVPPHLLAHHQFWSQAPTGAQGFATQRLINGVISSAVNVTYGQNVTGNANAAPPATSSGNVQGTVIATPSTTATACKYFLHLKLS